MTNEELISRMHNPAINQACLAEMQGILQEELDKPFEEQDQELINDLIQTITEMTGMTETVQEHAEAGIARMKKYSEQIPSKRKVVHIRWLIPIACAMILLTSNVLSYSVFGMNAFSAAYLIMNKGGISIDLKAQNEPMAESGNPYADDMRQICEEHGIDAKIPAYLPAGFTRSSEYGLVNEYPMKCEIIYFFGRNKEREKVVFSVINFDDLESMTPIGIPTDTYIVTQQVIDGTTIHIIKEDDQFKAAWLIGTTEYVLSTFALDYGESQRILESVFE